MAKFKFGQKYTLAEIEQLAGKKPNYHNASELYCVVDISGDFTQYDFSGDTGCLRLVFIDGKPEKEGL